MSLTIANLLRGCEVGRMQTVGIMQVIPLLSDLQCDDFVSPTEAKFSTSGYGNMVFENTSDKTMIVPSHAAYMTKQKAQDHAMAGAGFVAAKSRQTFDKAMCVQQTQGGYITPDKYRMALLPLSLREKALEKRNDTHFGKLWGDIGNFAAESGCRAAGGHLIVFMEQFQKELDQFIAEFEMVPRQVGAIVLIGGRVMGFERCPSQAYFKSIWQAMIRECYGSEAIHQSKLGAKAPRTAPIRSSSNLIDLREALKEARAAEEEVAKNHVRELIDDDFSVTNDGATRGAKQYSLHTITNPQFVGQIVKEDARVHYASLIAKSGWANTSPWHKAKKFAI